MHGTITRQEHGENFENASDKVYLKQVKQQVFISAAKNNLCTAWVVYGMGGVQHGWRTAYEFQ